MGRTKTIACLSLLLCADCSRPPHLVVGSKNFTEQELLGEIIAQQAERAGIPVDRKLALGGTLLAHEALTKGDIDVYPEYTGTALTAVLKQKPVKEADAAFVQVRSEYARRWKLEWLDPLGFNNTFAMVIRGDKARSAKLQTLSEAAAAQAWHLGMGYEFRQRPDGMDGLIATYKLRVSDNPVTMDLGLLYQALQTGKVDMVAANSTDGQLSRLDVRVLDDDKRYFPPYQCAMIVRMDAWERFPALRAALAQLSGKISDSAMRTLNNAVDGEHRPMRDVASEFLTKLGPVAR